MMLGHTQLLCCQTEEPIAEASSLCSFTFLWVPSQNGRFCECEGGDSVCETKGQSRMAWFRALPNNQSNTLSDLSPWNGRTCTHKHPVVAEM
jgi:hypothetical protein